MINEWFGLSVFTNLVFLFLIVLGIIRKRYKPTDKEATKLNLILAYTGVVVLTLIFAIRGPVA